MTSGKNTIIRRIIVGPVIDCLLGHNIGILQVRVAKEGGNNVVTQQTVNNKSHNYSPNYSIFPEVIRDTLVSRDLGATVVTSACIRSCRSISSLKHCMSCMSCNVTPGTLSSSYKIWSHKIISIHFIYRLPLAPINKQQSHMIAQPMLLVKGES
jgi:hypothetical protein